MKAFTHPPVSQTTIHLKDGSSYGKYWSYLRPTLVLEVDSKEWESTRVRNVAKTTWFDLVTSTNRIVSDKKKVLPFWSTPSKH